MIAEPPQKSYEMVGQSARLKQVLRLATRLGRGQWPVLLLGETGTGKELVAQTIHRAGPGGPFVTIDCTSMVGPLMESELFGYAKGAFTGANTSKMGLIEQADGGTAFFDEIGELPLELQGKLLRLLQEQEFRPVGSLQMKKSKFRVIAATNRELATEVQKGTFRQDLYFRLNVVTMRLAPLRDRREDLPSLIAHFLDMHGNGHTLSPDLLEMLMLYPWPGNVRELQNCVQGMVAVNTGPVLHAGDAPSHLQHHRESSSIGRLSFATNGAAAGRSSGDDPLPIVAPVIPLAEMERLAIIRALEYTKSDRVMAAHLLGIGRTTLYRKLKEYGIKG